VIAAFVIAGAAVMTAVSIPETVLARSVATLSTSAPVPDTVPDTTVAPDPSGGGIAIDWQTVMIIAAVIGIIVVGLSMIVSRRRAPRPIERRIPAARPATNPSLGARVVRDVQWFHDQLSLELLVGSAAEARGRWLVERPRVELMQRTAQELGAHNPGSGWPELAGAITELSISLDTATNIRTSADPTTITEAANVVNRRRQELQMRIDSVHRNSQR
jgi:hypothetical protein